MASNNSQCGPAETVLWTIVGVVALGLVIFGLMQLFGSSSGGGMGASSCGNQSRSRNRGGVKSTMEPSPLHDDDSTHHKSHQSSGPTYDTKSLKDVRKRVDEVATTSRRAKLDNVPSDHKVKLIDLVRGGKPNLKIKDLPRTGLTESLYEHLEGGHD